MDIAAAALARRVSVQAWREAHPERVVAYSRAWYSAHRAEKIADSRARRLRATREQRDVQNRVKREKRWEEHAPPSEATLNRLERALFLVMQGESGPAPWNGHYVVGLSRCRLCHRVITADTWCGDFDFRLAQKTWYAKNLHAACRDEWQRRFYEAHREQILAQQHERYWQRRRVGVASPPNRGERKTASSEPPHNVRHMNGTASSDLVSPAAAGSSVTVVSEREEVQRCGSS